MGRLTKQQAAIVSAYTGYLIGSFEELHKYVEKIMGRPVFTHEMGSVKIEEEIKIKSKTDFVALCPNGGAE